MELSIRGFHHASSAAQRDLRIACKQKLIKKIEFVEGLVRHYSMEFLDALRKRIYYKVTLRARAIGNYINLNLG